MIKAIRIIERLLTQSQFHEQQVMYQDYPPVDIVRKDRDEDDDEKNEDNMLLGFGAKDDKKKKEEGKKDEDLESQE